MKSTNIKYPSQVKNSKEAQNKYIFCDNNVNSLTNPIKYNKNQQPRVLALISRIKRQHAVAKNCGKLVNNAVHLSRKYIIEVIFKCEVKEDAARDLLNKAIVNKDIYACQGKDIGLRNWSAARNAYIPDNSWYYSLSPIEGIKNPTTIEDNLSGYHISLKLRKLGISYLEKKSNFYDLVKDLDIYHKEQLDHDERMPYQKIRTDVFEKVMKENGWNLITMRIFAAAFCSYHQRHRRIIIVDQYLTFSGFCKRLSLSGFVHTWFYMKSVNIWNKGKK